MLNIKVEILEETYVGGHQQYEEISTDISQDGSSKSSTLKGCPSRLDSRDGPGESLLQNDQREELIIIKVEDVEAEEMFMSARHRGKKEISTDVIPAGGLEDPHPAGNLSDIKHEDSIEEMCLNVIQRVEKEDIPVDICRDGSSKINPPERCPRPPYSQDCPEQDHNVPQDHQGVDLIVVKVEDLDDEEKYMRGVQPYEEEESPPDIRTGLYRDPEDYGIKPYSPGELSLTPDPLHIEDQTSDPSTGSSLDVITHSTDNYAGQVFPCPECGRTFKKKSHLVRHCFIHTGEKPFSCPDCGKSFVRKFNLELHQRNHTGDKPFPCPVCGKCFTFKSSLEAHQIVHTGEKPFPCSECGKCFTNRSNLSSHQRIHTGEQPFSCSECGKSFTQKTALVKHQRIHTGEQPYFCSHCGKYFRNKSSLDNHSKLHTGELPYSCSECGKCFVQKAKLVQHLRIHTGEKPFSCPICEKRFHTTSSLRAHQPVHDGQRKLPCPDCGKCFTRKSNLNVHQRIHMDKELFSCTECGKCYTRKQTLKNHQRTHEKPFPCTECEQRFTKKTHLVNHQQIHALGKPVSGNNLFVVSGNRFISFSTPRVSSLNS